MSNLQGANSNNIKTTRVLIILVAIVLVVISFYFAKFHAGLSDQNGDWGTFGDFVGGILNPVIAAFAFYLIAETYELQKNELEATRNLLKVSTNAQKEQLNLSALTTLLNLNLTEIGELKIERISLLKQISTDEKSSLVGLDPNSSEENHLEFKLREGFLGHVESEKQKRINGINEKILNLLNESEDIKLKIKKFTST